MPAQLRNESQKRIGIHLEVYRDSFQWVSFVEVYCIEELSVGVFQYLIYLRDLEDHAILLIETMLLSFAGISVILTRKKAQLKNTFGKKSNLIQPLTPGLLQTPSLNAKAGPGRSGYGTGSDWIRFAKLE